MKILYVIGGIILIGAAVWLVLNYVPTEEPLSSVPMANEYHSTSTGINGKAWEMINTLDTGNGAFGSVVITTAGTGKVTFYDATTSNAYLRPISANASTTTSSIDVLATFGTTATIGTYVFDVIYQKGILMVWEGTKALLGTTTITYRQY